MTTIRLGAPVGSAAGSTIRLGAPWGAGAQPVTIRLGAPRGGGPEQAIGSGPFLVVDPRDPSRTVPARLFVWLPAGVLPGTGPVPSEPLYPGESTFPGSTTYPGGETP